MLDARRRRDGVALSALSLLKTELVNASKDGRSGGEIADALVLQVARKEVKRREEAVDAYRNAGRAEAAEREEREAAVLRQYLPAQMSAEELERELRAIIEEVQPQGAGGFGAVMKVALARLQGRAEGGQIAATVRRLLA